MILIVWPSSSNCHTGEADLTDISRRSASFTISSPGDYITSLPHKFGHFWFFFPKMPQSILHLNDPQLMNKSTFTLFMNFRLHSTSKSILQEFRLSQKPSTSVFFQCTCRQFYLQVNLHESGDCDLFLMLQLNSYIKTLRRVAYGPQPLRCHVYSSLNLISHVVTLTLRESL